MEILHHLNIGLHIFCGSLSLLLGLVPLLWRKGGPVHRRFGRWFLLTTTGVLITAVLGLAVFNFRPFLATVVLLSVYQAYSGYRVLRTRATGPTRRDALFSAVFLSGSVGLLAVAPRLPVVWAPFIIYSTLGYLVTLTLYDLLRFAFVARWKKTLWLYDHFWKMMGSYSALLAAFTGTVLPQYKPYSQFLPSVVMTGLTLGFILFFALRPRSRRPVASVPAAA